MKNIIILLLFSYLLGTACLAQAPNMYPELDNLLEKQKQGLIIPYYKSKFFDHQKENPVDGKKIFRFALPQDTILQLLTYDGVRWILAKKGDFYRYILDANGNKIISWKDDCGNKVYQVYNPTATKTEKVSTEEKYIPLWMLSQLKVPGPRGSKGEKGDTGDRGLPGENTAASWTFWDYAKIIGISAGVAFLVDLIYHALEKKGDSDFGGTTKGTTGDFGGTTHSVISLGLSFPMSR